MTTSPGPWKAVNAGSPRARVEAADGQGVCTWARFPIDSCSEADLVLVAAAPELRDSLVEAAFALDAVIGEQLDSLQRTNGGALAEKARERTRALLARLGKGDRG